jgi:hypothetical protein
MHGQQDIKILSLYYFLMTVIIDVSIYSRNTRMTVIFYSSSSYCPSVAVMQFVNSYRNLFV